VEAVIGLVMEAVLTSDTTWHDASRDRDVPVRIYAPEKVTEPLLLVVFSHGLGGTREGYAYLGQYWASNGYICVHVQHLGSDAGIFRRGVAVADSARRAATDPQNWQGRPLDVSFAISQMLRDPRVNTNAIGVACHSFGAHTALEIVGLRVADKTFRDPRVGAAIAMSSPRPFSTQAFRDVATPCLHLTGTRDDSPVFAAKAADRRFAFDHIVAPNQYLVTLKDADHFAAADNTGWGRRVIKRDPRHHPWICQISTAFWDAFLKHDPKAEAWLAGEGLKNLLGSDGVVERK